MGPPAHRGRRKAQQSPVDPPADLQHQPAAENLLPRPRPAWDRAHSLTHLLLLLLLPAAAEAPPAAERCPPPRSRSRRCRAGGRAASWLGRTDRGTEGQADGRRRRAGAPRAAGPFKGPRGAVFVGRWGGGAAPIGHALRDVTGGLNGKGSAGAGRAGGGPTRGDPAGPGGVTGGGSHGGASQGVEFHSKRGPLGAAGTGGPTGGSFREWATWERVTGQRRALRSS